MSKKWNAKNKLFPQPTATNNSCVRYIYTHEVKNNLGYAVHVHMDKQM